MGRCQSFSIQVRSWPAHTVMMPVERLVESLPVKLAFIPCPPYQCSGKSIGLLKLGRSHGLSHQIQCLVISFNGGKAALLPSCRHGR